MLWTEDVPGRLRAVASELGGEAEVPDLPSTGPRDILVAYTRLFIGPGMIPAPPYGSVYLDREGQVQGPSTREVERFYAANGLAVERDAAELPDHAAIELEFSAHLLDQAVVAADADRRRQLLDRHEEFERRFLQPWLPEFGRRVAAAAVHPFYDGVGALLQVLPPVPDTSEAEE